MLRGLFARQLYPNRASFWLAIVLTAFNFFVLALFAIMRTTFSLPDPVTQVRGLASLHDAQNLIAIASLWGIGNMLLALCLVDALRRGGPKAFECEAQAASHGDNAPGRIPEDFCDAAPPIASNEARA